MNSHQSIIVSQAERKKEKKHDPISLAAATTDCSSNIRTYSVILLNID